MNDPNRVHWRDFIQTRAYAYAQFVMKLFKYELVVEMNDQNEATDVFIRQVPR